MQGKELEQKECFSRWYGWESPIGVTIFFVGGSLAVFLLAGAVNVIIMSVKN